MEHNLKNLIARYQAKGEDEVFTDIHRLASVKWKYFLGKLSAKYNLDEHTVSSVAHFKLYEAVVAYDDSKGDFANLLSKMIRNGCVDEIRKDSDRQRVEDSINKYEKPNEDDNEVSKLDQIAHANAEEEIIEHIQKSHDQHQLIVALTKTADEMTRQSLSAFAESDSYNAAAKLLGITDKTVKKHIRKLSRNYDGNRFGDYHDFFTVATAAV